jgi:hypothetical protein
MDGFQRNVITMSMMIIIIIIIIIIIYLHSFLAI